MDVKKIIKGVLLSLVFLSVFFLAVQKAWEAGINNSLFFLGSVSGSQSQEAQVSGEKNKTPEPPAPYRNWDVPELDLEAESGIVVESAIAGSDKIIFSKNSYMKLPIASLTKLMTAVVSLENYSLVQNIKISQDAFSQDGELGNLSLDMEMSVNDLLYVMLIESNNHAAYVLSEGMDKFDFVRLMNEKARELNMENTFFAEPTGLLPENVSTADDLIKLAKYILKNHSEISEISRLKEYDMPNYGKLTNTDQLLGEVPDIITGKTGFTIEANGCLLLIVNNSKADSYLIFVVLGANDRFGEVKKMIDWVNAAYSW